MVHYEISHSKTNRTDGPINPLILTPTLSGPFSTSHSLMRIKHKQKCESAV